MKLSETKAGKAWISQFDSQQDIAERLLDDLIIVNNQNLFSELTKMLKKVGAANSAPIAIYVAFEPDCEWTQKNGKMVSSFKRSFFEHNVYTVNFWRGWFRQLWARVIYWKKKYINRFPIHIHLDDVGSEGEMMHFVRNFCRANKGFLSHPSIDKIRKNKVRTVVFLDDFIGTGNRLFQFSKWFYQDRTIKSWISLKYMKIIAVAYASTSIGLEKVKKRPEIFDVIYSLYVSSGRTHWTQNEKKDYELFCKANYYGPLQKNYTPLGFKNTFSLLLFESGMPNNNPLVFNTLNISCIDANFFSAFDCTSAFNRIQKYLEEQNVDARLVLKEPKYLTDLTRMLLSIKKYAMKSEEDVSNALQIPLNYAKVLMNLCVENGLITKNGRITACGKKILAYYEKEKKRLTCKNDEFYYY